MSNEQPESGDEPTTAPSRRRLIFWVIGGVLVLAAVITAIAFAVAPRGDSADPTPSSSASASADASATPSASASPGASEPAPAPSVTPDDGNPFPELEPVAPEAPGAADGISAELVRFESVTGEVVGPGDVAAAAVRVTVDITNTGSNPIDLNLVVMNAYMGAQRDPAETYEQPGGSPVSGSLAPGDTATGVYLFRIPEDRRDDVTFVLDYMAGQPAITFRGPIPG